MFGFRNEFCTTLSTNTDIFHIIIYHTTLMKLTLFALVSTNYETQQKNLF